MQDLLDCAPQFQSFWCPLEWAPIICISSKFPGDVVNDWASPFPGKTHDFVGTPVTHPAQCCMPVLLPFLLGFSPQFCRGSYRSHPDSVFSFCYYVVLVRLRPLTDFTKSMSSNVSQLCRCLGCKWRRQPGSAQGSRPIDGQVRQQQNYMVLQDSWRHCIKFQNYLNRKRLSIFMQKKSLVIIFLTFYAIKIFFICHLCN